MQIRSWPCVYTFKYFLVRNAAPNYYPHRPKPRYKVDMSKTVIVLPFLHQHTDL